MFGIPWLSWQVAGPVLKKALPALKYVAIGGGCLIIAWFLWGKIEQHFKNYNTLIANEAKLKGAELANMNVIAALNNNITVLQQSTRDQAAAIARQQQVIEKANEYKDDVEEILAKHKLEELMAKKPGLVANVFNRGTADYFRMLEERSAALEDFYYSTTGGLPAAVENRPAESTASPAR